MYVIGVTGSLGTGKSTVTAMFRVLGAKVLDADRITHQQMVPGAACFKPVVRLLGKDILTAGRIDRKKVAARVFLNIKLLRKLEKILHPVVRKVILVKIKKYKESKGKVVVIVDVPLLFESKLDKHVDKVIVVKTNRATQIKRVTKDICITKVDALRRIKAQMPLQKKIRLADIIINNNGTLTNTKKQVKRIWEKL